VLENSYLLLVKERKIKIFDKVVCSSFCSLSFIKKSYDFFQQKIFGKFVFYEGQIELYKKWAEIWLARSFLFFALCVVKYCLQIC
jgi:hypothetical protein